MLLFARSVLVVRVIVSVQHATDVRNLVNMEVEVLAYMLSMHMQLLWQLKLKLYMLHRLSLYRHHILLPILHSPGLLLSLLHLLALD